MKVCPKCRGSVNVKRTACECGHFFAIKGKMSHDAVRKSKRVAMRCKRALESYNESMARHEQVQLAASR